MNIYQYAIAFLVVVIPAALCGEYAKAKGRSGSRWTIFTFLLSAFVIFPILFFVSDRGDSENSDKRRKTRIKLGSAIILFLCLIGAAIKTSIPGEEGGSDQTAKTSTNSSADVADKSSDADSQPATTNVAALLTSGSTFKPGSYAKGIIPKGEYIFVSKDGGYFSEELNGQIIDNENFPSFGYVYVHGIGDIKNDGYLISPSAVQKIGYVGALDVYQAMNRQTGYNFSGTYKVGVDIPAGRYTLESAGDAYIAVVTGPLGKGEIVWNDNFNGSRTANLSIGQYLQVSNASIAAVSASANR
ncbi:hypothetical protein [Paraburkholderia antibiotica]|uniref:Uncharacterized protein n=1 Tax=Paraburkholderia antibiotica TaxID=2728839 RepID=A0A7X9X264_9BURK|nr:hypothetical protein [Paraburkholderia antibiotica]NML30048.1 hypothetical protein [Paraburkholderia antibiotica]